MTGERTCCLLSPQSFIRPLRFLYIPWRSSAELPPASCPFVHVRQTSQLLHPGLETYHNVIRDAQLLFTENKGEKKEISLWIYHKNRRKFGSDSPLHLRSQEEKPGTHTNFSTPWSEGIELFHLTINKWVWSNQECQKCFHSRSRSWSHHSFINCETATSLVWGPSWLGDSEWDARPRRNCGRRSTLSCRDARGDAGGGAAASNTKSVECWSVLLMGGRCKVANLGGVNITSTKA